VEVVERSRAEATVSVADAEVGGAAA
jgi:hypothetical protein